MTLAQAQAQYESILKSLGVSETEFQSRRMQFSTGDARLRELAFLEDVINRLTAQQGGSTTASRCTLATFKRG